MVLTKQEETEFVVLAQQAFQLIKANTTNEKERERKIYEGRKAIKILVDENYYLILQEARKFYNGIDLEWWEYINQGILGFHRGIIEFEISKGFRLSTFAVYWIRGSMRELRDSNKNLTVSYEVLENCLVLENSMSMSEQPFSDLEIKKILAYVDDLPDLERGIIYRWFGLDGYKKITLKAIGRCYNLNENQVRRIKNKAIRKLKSQLEN